MPEHNYKLAQDFPVETFQQSIEIHSVANVWKTILYNGSLVALTTISEAQIIAHRAKTSL